MSGRRLNKHKRNKKKQAATLSKPSAKTSPLQMKRPDVNSRISITRVAQYPHSSPLASHTTPTGKEGLYTVTFVFCIPGNNVFREALDYARIMESGDSLLRMPKGSDTLMVNIENSDSMAAVKLFSNHKGNLSSAAIVINAKNFGEAIQLGHDSIFPVLSYYSYVHNVSLDSSGYEIVEEKTKSKRWNFGVVGRIKNFHALGSSHLAVSDIGFRRLFAAYREGMNATNVFYQALSYYKVIEGTRRLQLDRHRKCKAEHKDIRDIPLKIPDTIEELSHIDEFERDAFVGYLGSKLTKIADEYRALIRNAIAHLNPDELVLDTDKYEDTQKCESAIPVLRYIAHQMLSAEIQLSEKT